MVARLTPDQKAACSNHVGVITCIFIIIFSSFTINLRGSLHFLTTFKKCAKSLSIDFPHYVQMFFYKILWIYFENWKKMKTTTFIRKVFWIIVIIFFLYSLKNSKPTATYFVDGTQDWVKEGAERLGQGRQNQRSGGHLPPRISKEWK